MSKVNWIQKVNSTGIHHAMTSRFRFLTRTGERADSVRASNDILPFIASLYNYTALLLLFHWVSRVSGLEPVSWRQSVAYLMDTSSREQRCFEVSCLQPCQRAESCLNGCECGRACLTSCGRIQETCRNAVLTVSDSQAFFTPHATQEALSEGVCSHTPRTHALHEAMFQFLTFC